MLRKTPRKKPLGSGRAKYAVAKTVADIKALRIQGASQVRKAVVGALRASALGSSAASVGKFQAEMRHTMLMLVTARPTEPGTRTAARIILRAINAPAKDVDDARVNVAKVCENYERDREAAMKTIAKYGARLIPKNAVVLTHCHSHTVEAVLMHAKNKIDHVIATETRPLWQGRITATNLSGAGIEVVQVVDSAAASMMKKADVFITGCDAILGDGSIVN